MTKITNSQIAKFKDYLENEEKSKNTIEKYVRDVNAFADWMADRKLCKGEVLNYKKHLQGVYAPASVNSILSSLNSFFDFYNLYNMKVKMLKIQKQIFVSEGKELTKEEYNRLVSAAKSKGKEQLSLIMQTICACGIRVSELCYINVESVKSGRATINLKGKIRTVIIPKQLCTALLKYTRKRKIQNGSIFITKRGMPLSRTQIWRQMKALCKEANVLCTKVFPHNLRHLFARTYYAVQKDIVRLADILGHSSVNTTRIYTMEAVYCKGG